MVWERSGRERFEGYVSGLIQRYCIATEENNPTTQFSLERQLRIQLTSFLYERLPEEVGDYFIESVYGSFSINEKGDLEVVDSVELWHASPDRGRMGRVTRYLHGMISLFEDNR